MTEPVPGRKPVSALLTRLLCAALLVLPVFGAQAGVVFTSLHLFQTFTNGAYPNQLVQGSDGDFYGTAYTRGANNYGTVFKISTNGVVTSLYSFTGGNDGANPESGLVQGSDGNFYGTTFGGGTNGNGTVFKIGSNGALTSLYSFTGGKDGANPRAGLLQGNDGDFYGTTSTGGTSNYGTVFQIRRDGAYTSLYSFTGTNDGAYPESGLVQGSDGNFYGTTFGWSGPFQNGPYVSDLGYGTVFELSTNGALTTLYSFTNWGPYYPFGRSPEARLVQGSDGYFYGTTFGGGFDGVHIPDGYGTVFKISPNGTLTTLYSFDFTDGANPSAGLVEGSDGNFYGTTYNGGKYGPVSDEHYGTVFQISTNGSLTTLHFFTGGSDGAGPQGALVQGSDGNFYGTTSGDLSGGAGTVFRLTIVPEFQAVTLTNGTLSLTWSTEAGGTYQPQFSSDLGSSNWANLGGALTAAGATLSATDSVTNGPRRFYRVVLLP